MNWLSNLVKKKPIESELNIKKDNSGKDMYDEFLKERNKFIS
jgi:hypothetical protein